MSVENPNAFPFAAEYGHPGACGGMTLRDYFAGQALPYACSINEQYLKAHPDASYPFHAAIARDAYEIADAMLSARQETRHGE